MAIASLAALFGESSLRRWPSASAASRVPFGPGRSRSGRSGVPSSERPPELCAGSRHCMPWTLGFDSEAVDSCIFHRLGKRLHLVTAWLETLLDWSCSFRENQVQYAEWRAKEPGDRGCRAFFAAEVSCPLAGIRIPIPKFSAEPSLPGGLRLRAGAQVGRRLPSKGVSSGRSCRRE